jgi:hypothetical protein
MTLISVNEEMIEDDDGSDVPDEEHHDDRGEERAEDQVFLEGRDRRVDEARVVANDRNRDAGGERALDRVEPGTDAFDHGHRVLAHGAANVEHDGGGLAKPDRRGRPLERVLYMPDVRNADRRPVFGGDDDVGEVTRRVDAAERSQQQLPFALLDRSAGDLDILGNYGVANFCDR